LKKIKEEIFLTLILLLLAVFTVQAADWQTVKTFTGSGTDTYNTDNFSIPGSEWRITWSYTPDSQFPEMTLFNVVVYPKGETALYVDFIMKSGAADTSGASYFHQGPGDYYLKINVANTEGYTITVQYDTESVPRAAGIGSWVVGAAVLVIIIVVIIGGVFYIIKRRKIPQP